MRLAARLARAAGRVHPQDWLSFYESHTPFEWQLQETLAVVDPWGDERDDLRAAVNTMIAIPHSDEVDRMEVMEHLTGYLKIHAGDE